MSKNLTLRQWPFTARLKVGRERLGRRRRCLTNREASTWQMRPLVRRNLDGTDRNVCAGIRTMDKARAPSPAPWSGSIFPPSLVGSAVIGAARRWHRRPALRAARSTGAT